VNRCTKVKIKASLNKKEELTERTKNRTRQSCNNITIRAYETTDYDFFAITVLITDGLWIPLVVTIPLFRITSLLQYTSWIISLYTDMLVGWCTDSRLLAFAGLWRLLYY